ncbi:MAG: PilT/PilU family type 4a pilus ATPase [Planctomycetota bacterium]
MTVAAAEPDVVQSLLREVLSARGRVSDINLTVGRAPQMEADGRLVAVPGRAPLTGEDTTRLVTTLLGEEKRLWDDLHANGSCDCAYALAGGPRFRVNVFKTCGHFGVVLRVLPSEVPTLESLKLPPILDEIAGLANGLVLVTGATGSGKSTTLAAVIDRINRTKAVHVLTLEDPIEFRHPHKTATVNQRELGSDFTSFAAGLRAALRQAPKVILVGEIRDRDTVEIALKAAETGHLVLSTMHTIDAGQTVNRIVGMFEADEQRVIRGRLADTLRMVVSQRLLPRESGGRVAALEVMGNNLPVREMIKLGEKPDRTFYDLIGDGARVGWQTFDQHITRLLAEGAISEETAFTYCTDKSVVRRAVDQLKNKRGESTSDLGDLQMDRPIRRK